MIKSTEDDFRVTFILTNTISVCLRLVKEEDTLIRNL